MIRTGKIISFLFVTILFVGLTYAQNYVINAEQVQVWMGSGKKVLLIDVRSSEEYREGHIPGAVNIPAEQVVAESTKLPKNKSTNLIFYCRGVG